MIRVSPSVPPFKCFMSWNIYVLESYPPHMIRHCQGGGWGGGLQRPGGGENKILR